MKKISEAESVRFSLAAGVAPFAFRSLDGAYARDFRLGGETVFECSSQEWRDYLSRDERFIAEARDN